jgi:hypothetical protein
LTGKGWDSHSRFARRFQALIDLYTAWHTAEPGKGYDAKAAEWKARLDAAKAASAKPPTSPASAPAGGDVQPK